MHMDDVRKNARDVAEKILNESKRPIGKETTLDGEVAVYMRDGKLKKAALSVVSYDGEQRNFHEHDTMAIMYTAIMQIKEKMPARKVPLTRTELLHFGSTKTAIKGLEKAGLVKDTLIKLMKSSKATAVRVCYFTPEGRAYVRKYFDESYGCPAESVGHVDAGGDDASLQPDVEGLAEKV